MSGLELRPLSSTDFDEVHATFVDAFSDYIVKLTPSSEQLREMLTRRGWSPALSCAAFDAGRMVGFTLNALEGESGYDSGTGVIPSHRRRGLGTMMMARSFELLRAAGATRYVLEVIEGNTKAVELYLHCGFHELRRFQCWTAEPAAVAGDGASASTPGTQHAAEITAPDWEALSSMWEVEPAWQNSIASIRRAAEPFRVLGDERGYVVVFPGSGDVPQLAVAPAQRRKGLGRKLLESAASAAGKPLRIFNIDAGDAGIARFLDACGARPIVRQIEMCVAL